MKRPIDREAIDRLVLESLPAALRFATRLTGDPLQAEEVLQEALLKVLKRWKTLDDEAKFRGWLLSIVVNAHRDRWRKQQREEPLDLPPADAAPTVHQQAEATETAQRVRQAIDRLPPRQREVAISCLAEGLSPVEAARVLGTTENNIHTTLHAVRARIAQALGLTDSPTK